MPSAATSLNITLLSVALTFYILGLAFDAPTWQVIFNLFVALWAIWRLRKELGFEE